MHRHIGQRRRVVLRRNHGIHPGPVGTAQTGPQIARIGHTVQQQQERRPLAPLQIRQQRGQIRADGLRLHLGHHALVTLAPRHPVQPPGLHARHLHGLLLRQLQQVSHPIVVTVPVDIKRLETGRCLAQTRHHRMKAVEQHDGTETERNEIARDGTSMPGHHWHEPPPWRTVERSVYTNESSLLYWH